MTVGPTDADEPAVSIYTFFHVAEVPAFDDAVAGRLAPPTSNPDLLRASASVTSSQDDLGEGLAVEQLDIAGRMGQQQFDGLRLVTPGRIVGIGHESPEAAFAQAGGVVFARFGQPPGPGVPVQVVTAVVGDDDLLTEPVVAMGIATFALTAPDADQRQQRQQRVVEFDAVAQVGGVGRHRQVVEDRNVAGRRFLGPLGGSRYGSITGARPGSALGWRRRSEVTTRR